MGSRSFSAEIPSMNLSHVLPQQNVKDLVQNWLREDSPSFDYGGVVVGDHEETALLLCKSRGVLAGVPFVNALFEELGCSVEWCFDEGVMLEPICTVAFVRGKVNKLLLGERVALNCLTRASGVATKARELWDLKNSARWHGEIAGTRKTTPGFRLVEKYSLLIGGISTHRYDLSSMIMLKDNHIWTAGNITQAVKNAKKVGGFSTKIEVECRSIEEANEAMIAGADVIMLDNFSPEAIHPSAKQLKDSFPHVIIEASGGINEQTIKSYFGPHVDVVSMGLLTQGYKTTDFSLKIKKDGHNPNNPIVKL